MSTPTMSTPHSEDETQLETQDEESQYQEAQNDEDEEMVPPESAGMAHVAAGSESVVGQEIQAPTRTKKLGNEKEEPEREPGSVLFPTSRVQKIIKADKEIPIVAKEATFLISLATEEFIKRLVEACYVASQKEKRTMIHHKDLVTVTRKADEFLFLEEVVHWKTEEAPATKRPRNKTKTAGGDDKTSDTKPIPRPGTLEHFALGSKKVDDGYEGDDIVMTADGTMYAAGNADADL